MKLVETLASGVAVAAVGTAILNKRGTATRAQYYRDFEASQVYTTQPIVLDSSGSTVIYVNELVDVLVYDSTGTLVREFVAGDSAPAVEVISQSFTGTSYSDGSSGTSKPTTLQRVLDGWLTSAGAADFNVVPSGGSQLTLSQALSALSGVFFNVKTYGAIGNGTADDSVAINNAYTAAAATASGGGTVLFPPGQYRAASNINIPGGTKTLGVGGAGSQVILDGAFLTVSIAASANLTTVEGMYFTASLTSTPGFLVRVSSVGRVHLSDCTIVGNSTLGTIGLFLAQSAGGAGAETTLTRCLFRAVLGVISMGSTSAAQTVRYVDCEFVNEQTVGIVHVYATEGTTLRGCKFSSASVTAGTTHYVRYGDTAASTTTAQTATAIGNVFGENGTVVPVAFFNAFATPDRDFVEVGNLFGFNPGILVTPYAYTTDGYGPRVSTVGWHGSRCGERENLAGGVTVACTPKRVEATVVNQTAGAAMALNPDKGCMGDVWYLTVINTSGGALTVTPNAAVVILDASAASFAVANNTRRMMIFHWLPLAAGTAGVWTQVATSTVG